MTYGCCTQSFTIMSKENIYSNAKLTTSIIMTNATNVQIKLSFEDIQQLKGKKVGGRKMKREKLGPTIFPISFVCYFLK